MTPEGSSTPERTTPERTPPGPVLVTGATGFLGTHLCRTLADRGWDVRALRRSTSDVTHLEAYDLDWRVGDVLDEPSIREAAAGCVGVFHLAGVGLAAADPETVRRVNAEGTDSVLSACHDVGVERVVFTSTAGTRRSEGVATETDTAPPIGAYQESKARAEAIADQYVEQGLDVVTVHPTSAFGPGDEEFTARLLTLATDPKMVASLPGGVSFVGVDDVIEGMVAAFRKGGPGEHYILGGQNLTFPRALAIIAEESDGYRPLVSVPKPAVHALGHAAEAADEYVGVRFFPFTSDMARLATRNMFYSSEKAREELDYDFRPLRAHVPRALEWYRNGRLDA